MIKNVPSLCQLITYDDSQFIQDRRSWIWCWSPGTFAFAAVDRTGEKAAKYSYQGQSQHHSIRATSAGCNKSMMYY